MRHRPRLPGILAAGLVASAVVASLLTSPTASAAVAIPRHAAAAPSAGPSPHTSAPPPTGASTAGTDADAVRQTRLPASRLRPQRPVQPQTSMTSKTSKTSKSSAKPGAGSAARAATQSCTPADFSSRTGSALVAFVEGSTQDCLGTLFGITGSDAHGVFQESQMVTVANAFRGVAASYPGDDSTFAAELEYFLRAGYYVQYYDSGDVGTYDATLSTAIEGALDTFFASPHLLDVTDANGAVVGDVVILSDSADEQARYISTYKRILTSYTSAWDASSAMDGVVYDVYTPLWRGQWNPAFITAVTADPSVFDTLSAFALNHESLLGGDNTFLDADAGNDLAVYVQVPALQAKLRPLMLGLLHASAMTGPTAALWVMVANQAGSYDQANCSYYGVCNLAQQLTAAVLTVHNACTSTITVTAESLSAGDVSAVCTSLAAQVPWFQNFVHATGPIPGQTITGENMIVFASRLDYQIYAGPIYGIDTDNGGETITGDPTQAGNSSYSVMYQAPYASDFPADVWNLNHEFTHYLDAVYDMKGDFTTQTSVADIWWIEGVAEYVSYTYRGVTDTEALADAPLHTYSLSTLFQNTYAIDTETRTYPWGYLAVRYMVEKHPDLVSAVLGHFRGGDYTGGYAVYNSLGTAYDADFDAWLDSLGGGTGTGTPTAAFTVATSGLTAAFTDHSTESGTGSLTGWSWSFGDGTTSTAQNPSHTYAAGGSYPVTLTVTDSTGKTASTSQTVAVSLPACTAADPRAMGQNCARTGQAATAGNTDYLYIWLPAGTTTLTVTTGGGTGNADLYYDPATWAGPGAYTAKSTGSGTTENLTVTNTTAGYRYISLYAVTGFSGVTVTTRY